MIKEYVRMCRYCKGVFHNEYGVVKPDGFFVCNPCDEHIEFVLKSEAGVSAADETISTWTYRTETFRYTPVPDIVMARQVARRERVNTELGEELVSPGNWIVEDFEGNRQVVADCVFKESFSVHSDLEGVEHMDCIRCDKPTKDSEIVTYSGYELCKTCNEAIKPKEVKA